MTKETEPREHYEDVGSPLEIATHFLNKIKPHFPEEFDPNKRFFINSSNYEVGDFANCRLASSGESLQVSMDDEYNLLWEPIIAAGYQPVCDGKRPMGGALERFLVAYWALADDWPNQLIWGNAVDWLRIGLLMGGAMNELSDLFEHRLITAADWWELPP